MLSRRKSIYREAILQGIDEQFPASCVRFVFAMLAVQDPLGEIPFFFLRVGRALPVFLPIITWERISRRSLGPRALESMNCSCIFVDVGRMYS